AHHPGLLRRQRALEDAVAEAHRDPGRDARRTVLDLMSEMSLAKLIAQTCCGVMAQTDAGPAVVSAISTCVVWVAHTLCRRSQALNSTVYSPAASPLEFQWIVNSSFTPALAGCAVPKMCRPVRASTMAKDTLSRATLTV